MGEVIVPHERDRTQSEIQRTVQVAQPFAAPVAAAPVIQYGAPVTTTVAAPVQYGAPVATSFAGVGAQVPMEPVAGMTYGAPVATMQQMTYAAPAVMQQTVPMGSTVVQGASMFDMI